MAWAFLRRCKYLAALPAPKVFIAWPFSFTVQEQRQHGQECRYFRNLHFCLSFAAERNRSIPEEKPVFLNTLQTGKLLREHLAKITALWPWLKLSPGQWSLPRTWQKSKRIDWCDSWGSAVQGVRLDNPWRLLPAQDILWYHDFLLLQSSCSVVFCSVSSQVSASSNTSSQKHPTSLSSPLKWKEFVHTVNLAQGWRKLICFSNWFHLKKDAINPCTSVGTDKCALCFECLSWGLAGWRLSSTIPLSPLFFSRVWTLNPPNWRNSASPHTLSRANHPLLLHVSHQKLGLHSNLYEKVTRADKRP